MQKEHARLKNASTGGPGFAGGRPRPIWIACCIGEKNLENSGNFRICLSTSTQSSAPGSFWGSLGSRSRSHGCKLREQPILLKANLLSEGFHESWHALLRYPSSFSSPRIGALLQTGLNELGRCSPPAELASGPEHENSYTLALIVFRRGDIGMRLASDNFIP
jgi:hypothetical protein